MESEAILTWFTILILRKCVSLLHCRPHNCSKMSGILRARAATESAECSALPGVASCLTTASLLDVLCYHCPNHCTATLRGECLCVTSCKVGNCLQLLKEVTSVSF